MGVTKENGKFRARVNDAGKRVSLGMYDTERKAKLAITRWKKQHDFSDVWVKKNNGLDDFKMDFEEMKPKKTITLHKPAFIDRLTAKIKEWRS